MQSILLRLSQYQKISLVIALSLLLSACVKEEQQSLLTQIKQSGELHVKTTYGPTNYYIEGNKPTGLEYELLKSFSEYLNVKLVIHPHYSIKSMLSPSTDANISLVAAGLNSSKSRLTNYKIGPSYYQVKSLLIYRKGSLRPRKIEQIQDIIYVVKSSSHEEYVKQLQQEYPKLNIQYKTFPDQEIMFRNLEEGKIKLAMTNNTALSQYQYYYPHLAKALTLKTKLDIVWLMEKGNDDSLANAVLEFFTMQQTNGKLEQLKEKYFGHINTFDYVDTRIFLKRVVSQLPKYDSLFKKYAGQLDWRLLAAVSYQESHWNPRAKSPTGVRGMMMLTWPTAKAFGVTSRLNAEQSIRGGAAYLSKLINRLPDSIPENEKPWFALAAYNIGYSHMMDARKITTNLGQNKNSWYDVKEVIPLLQQPEWYKYTQYGFARGNEAVKYVSNIRKYYDSLRWYDEQLSLAETVNRNISPIISTASLDNTL